MSTHQSEEPSEEYLKYYVSGFNHGIYGATHNPEYLDKVLEKAPEDLPYYKGLRAGKKQYLLDQELIKSLELRERLKTKKGLER